MSADHVACVIPWRPEPGREPLLAAVRRRLAEILPGVPQILADSDHQPFSRAGSRNAGVREAGNAGAEVVVICDADTICQPGPLREAVTAAADGRLHWPYTTYRVLTERETVKWFNGKYDLESGLGAVHRGAVGGVLVCRVDTYWRLAGQDEQFVGWGMEDTAFAHVAATLVGTARHDGYVLHLWHRDTRGIGGPNWRANAARCNTYTRADADQIRDMIGARMSSNYLTGLADGNYHRGGIRALQVGVVARVAALAAELGTVIAERPSSRVTVGHITGWTKPVGEVRQWSLWNTHGRTDDTSDDFALFKPGKRVPAGLAGLAGFAAELPNLVNLRLNMLGPGGALSPHEEHLPIPLPGGKVGLRARFHLPVSTNPGATVDADGQRYHFQAGKVYLFNNGCVHSARNAGPEPRYHLVWDQLLTRPAHDTMFERGTSWIRHELAELEPVETFPVGKFETQPGMTASEFAERTLVFMP